MCIKILKKIITFYRLTLLLNDSLKEEKKKKTLEILL